MEEGGAGMGVTASRGAEADAALGMALDELGDKVSL